LNDLRAADEDLRAVDDGHGQPMVQVEGVSQAQVDDFLLTLDELRRNLSEYAFNWRVADRIRQQSGTSGSSQ
jgi:hypothetical protein